MKFAGLSSTLSSMVRCYGVHIRLGYAKMSLHLFLARRIFGADFMMIHPFFRWTYGVHHGTF
jgi:hypothetical protein